MVLTLRVVLIGLAVVLFVIAAAGIPSRVNLVAAGLALWALAQVLP